MSPNGNGRHRRTSDPHLLAEEIERTRIDIGDTVESLTARTHVRDQARERAAEVVSRAKERLSSGSDVLRRREFRARAGEAAAGRGEQIRAGLPDRARDLAGRAAEAAREHPGQTAWVIAAVVAVRFLVGRRRRHRRSRAAQG